MMIVEMIYWMNTCKNSYEDKEILCTLKAPVVFVKFGFFHQCTEQIICVGWYDDQQKGE